MVIKRATSTSSKINFSWFHFISLRFSMYVNHTTNITFIRRVVTLEMQIKTYCLSETSFINDSKLAIF